MPLLAGLLRNVVRDLSPLLILTAQLCEIIQVCRDLTVLLPPVIGVHLTPVICVQVGHAVCATLTPGHDPVQKVTLIPRGQASLISKQQIMARIVGALGGRAAEEIIFGTPEVTTGASSDLQQVLSLLSQPAQTMYHAFAFCRQTYSIGNRITYSTDNRTYSIGR